MNALEAQFHFSFLLKKRSERHKIRELADYVAQIADLADIRDGLEIVIAELVNNAVKAELKRIFFAKKGFSFDDPQSYQKGLEAFHCNYAYLNFMYYEDAMSGLHLRIDVDIDMEESRILLYVRNDKNMPYPEERSLRRKLKRAMDLLPNDLVDLYVYYGDETGENGLGLTLVVDTIRRMGFDPEHLRVYNEGKCTVARLELPLGSKYSLKRSIFDRGR